MATNSSSPQYTFYLHKGLPTVHLGAPADFFDTRRLVSGGQRGGVLVADGLFLVAGRVLSVTDGLLPGTKRTNSASRAQNRGFCAREEVKVASGSIRVTFLQITAHTFKT